MLKLRNETKEDIERAEANHKLLAAELKATQERELERAYRLQDDYLAGTIACTWHSEHLPPDVIIALSHLHFVTILGTVRRQPQEEGSSKLVPQGNNHKHSLVEDPQACQQRRMQRQQRDDNGFASIMGIRCTS